jgi:hypothetical protein
MIHPESSDMEDVQEALRHNRDTTFLIHGIIDSGAPEPAIAGHLAALFNQNPNVYFSVDAALMLGSSIMDACMYTEEQFLSRMRSPELYRSLLADSVTLWKPVIDAYPTRMTWGTDLYYWWHYEPEVLHEIAEFGRAFIAQLTPEAQERFAYRNARDMLGGAFE